MTTRVHAADGQLVAEYAHERRLYLPIQAIPTASRPPSSRPRTRTSTSTRASTITASSARCRRTSRASAAASDLVGASTITQQVAQELPAHARSDLERKIKEGSSPSASSRPIPRTRSSSCTSTRSSSGSAPTASPPRRCTYFDKSVHELTLAEIGLSRGAAQGPEQLRSVQLRRPRPRAAQLGHRPHGREWLRHQAEDGETAKAGAARRQARATRDRPSSRPTISPRKCAANSSTMYGETTLYEGGLSVRTSLDPALQVMARQALMDGLIKFDQNQGWRGPVTTSTISARTGARRSPTFRPSATWSNGGWRSCCRSTARRRRSGCSRPRVTGVNAVDPKRETGTIAFNDMKWAKWAVGPRRQGHQGRRRRPEGRRRRLRRPGRRRRRGQRYALRQVPEIEGALVAMDPHTGRVLAMVGGFSFSPRASSTAPPRPTASRARRSSRSSIRPRSTTATRRPRSSWTRRSRSIRDRASRRGRRRTTATTILGPVDAADRHRAVAQRHDRAPGAGHGHAAGRRIRPPLRRLRQPAAGAVDGAGRRRDDGAADDRRPMRSSPTAARKIKPTLIDRIQDRYGKTIFQHDDRVCEGCDADDWQRPGRADVDRQSRAGARPDDRLPDHLDDGGRRPARHRRRRAKVDRQAGRRQDRHHQRQQGCLVHRLHAGSRGRPLHRLRQAAPARRTARPAAGSRRRSSPNSCRWRWPTSRPSPFRVPQGHGASCRSTARPACAPRRATPARSWRLQAGHGAADTYSIIGFTDPTGRPVTVLSAAGQPGDHRGPAACTSGRSEPSPIPAACGFTGAAPRDLYPGQPQTGCQSCAPKSRTIVDEIRQAISLLRRHL